jgi:hypothetical protein
MGFQPVELEIGRQATSKFAEACEQFLWRRRLFDLKRASARDMDLDIVAFLKTQSFDNGGGKTDGEAVAPFRAGCEWKSVIGYSRFDDIKDLAIGNRYAVLMGKPFE